MEIFHHKHKCEKCEMEFKTKEELDEHMKTHMQQPEQPAQDSPSQQPQSDSNVDQQEQAPQESAPEQPQNQDNQQ